MTGAEGDDADLLAAEYVLGTLDGQERAAFDGRLLREDGIRDAVTAWERRLAPLTRLPDEITPPADTWLRIQAAIDATSPQDLGSRSIRRDEEATVIPLRRSRDRWRFGAVTAAAVAAAFAGFVVVHDVALPWRGDIDATYVAAVNRGGEKPALIVTVNMHTRQVLVRPIAAQVPAGHSLQLWYIGHGAAPRSMGLVSDASAHLAIPDGSDNEAGASFAVSLEPVGGSTTGAPTGSVLYAGQLVRE